MPRFSKEDKGLNLPAGGETTIELVDEISGDEIPVDTVSIYIEDVSGSVSSFDVALRIWEDSRGGSQVGNDIELVGSAAPAADFTTDIAGKTADLVVKNNDNSNAGTIDYSIYGVSDE